VTEPRPRIVEWYRADPGPRMRRILVAGPAILTLGGLVIAASFLTHLPRDARLVSALVGFVFVAGGALFTMVAMNRLLRDDVYLALRTDGLVLRSPEGETLVPWDTLESARWEASRAELVLARTGAAPVRVQRGFGRVSGAELAARIEQTRRRAAMNLLR